MFVERPNGPRKDMSVPVSKYWTLFGTSLHFFCWHSLTFWEKVHRVFLPSLFLAVNFFCDCVMCPSLYPRVTWADLTWPDLLCVFWSGYKGLSLGPYKEIALVQRALMCSKAGGTVEQCQCFRISQWLSHSFTVSQYHPLTVSESQCLKVSKEFK